MSDPNDLFFEEDVEGEAPDDVVIEVSDEHEAHEVAVEASASQPEYLEKAGRLLDPTPLDRPRGRGKYMTVAGKYHKVVGFTE